jgi:membrane-associated protein
MLTEFITNIDTWLSQLSVAYPIGVYLVFFTVVFVETSFFPAAPVLPGDGLLFLVGVLAASGSDSFWIAASALISGGILGNFVAYSIGKWIAPKDGKPIRWLKKETYNKAQQFYNKHGVKALFYSRFIPLIRSVVPLAAGVALMDYKNFTKYSVVSVMLWVFLIMTIAFYLGHISWIKHNFTLIILVFTVLSALPIFIMRIKVKFLKLNK